MGGMLAFINGYSKFSCRGISQSAKVDVTSLMVIFKQEADETTLQKPEPRPLARLVLWFHHIKDLTKRKNIVGWANELEIRGFSKPGFPGVIICEGRKADVQASHSADLLQKLTVCLTCFLPMKMLQNGSFPTRTSRDSPKAPSLRSCLGNLLLK